jgi:RNA polymerase sigma-70 factor (ECF subfamily)
VSHAIALGVSVPDDVRASFDDFVTAERRHLLAVAFSLCADRHAAEDLVQDALVEAYRRWPRLSHYDDPGAWARRVVVTRATSLWRRRRNERVAVQRLDARPDAAPVEEDVDAFWRVVRALPPRQAQVVALRYADDLEVAEIGRVLGIAEGTVKATLSQARAAIARMLALEVDDA